jgi:hypothetical protein
MAVLTQLGFCRDTLQELQNNATTKLRAKLEQPEVQPMNEPNAKVEQEGKKKKGRPSKRVKCEVREKLALMPYMQDLTEGLMGIVKFMYNEFTDVV